MNKEKAESLSIKGDFKLTPEFLRDIVAKHTFHNSAAAALRELIQNAHDACIVRCAIDGKDDGEVDVLLDPQEGVITITDNGVGMTEGDIQEYLTTVGRGKKGSSIAERYGIPNDRKNRLINVVGEFGFGFIASFIIADKIEIFTRHSNPEAKSLKCIFSTSGIAYQIEETAHELPVGTRLVLHLNNEHRHPQLRPPKTPLEGSIISFDTVDAVIKKYCLLLQYPITVTLQGEPAGPRINVTDFPWQERTNMANKVKSFYENRQGQGALGEPLLTIPFNLSKENGDDANVEGILVVDGRRSGTFDEQAKFGNLEVFVKRMWVCENQKQLLPHWAWFITGILVTPDLRPLPGRDGLESQHESFDRVKRAMHKLLATKFLEIAQKNQPLFARIQDDHGTMLRAGLTMERELAENDKHEFIEAELLRYIRLWRYSSKYLQGSACTLNEYLGLKPDVSLDTKEQRHKVYYVPRPISPNRQREFLSLLTSSLNPVIVPQDPTEAILLVTINNTFKDVTFQSVETDLLSRYAGILQGEERDRWNLFLKYFSLLNGGHRMKSADVGAMQPDYMPAMVLNVASDGDEANPSAQKDSVTDDKDSIQSDQLKATLLPHLPEQLRKLYSQTVVINTRNRVMKALLEYKEKQKLEEIDDVLANCLHECYHLAVLSAMDIVPPEWLQHNVDHQCNLILHYIASRTEFADEKERSATLQRALDESKDTLKLQHEVSDTISSGGISMEEVRSVPLLPEDRLGIVVVCDLVSSTESLLRMDFAQRGELMNQFVEAAKTKVREHGGFFDKFTGDGIVALFGTKCKVQPGGAPRKEECTKAAEQAWSFQLALNSEIDKLGVSDLVKSIRFKNPAVDILRTRIALDAGSISFGKYGGLGTAVGLPVITAFRLCGEKEAYYKAGHNALVTESFADYFDRTAFSEVSYDFNPKGLNAKVKIFQKRH